jgi:hypothetical protein
MGAIMSPIAIVCRSHIGADRAAAQTRPCEAFS